VATRDLVIELKSKWDDSGFRNGNESAKAFARELAKLERAAQQQRDAMVGVGQGLLAFGAAATAGIGLATKAAIDWESAWAGVTKTVDGSPQQMAQLEGALRGLARELPATHKEIAGVAEAAGQLGVKREDILAFTKVMVQLGTTTDLTAEEAATALARLSNIMGTSSDDTDKLGAALVALGNNGASTESEILAMSLRIAGAGKTVGMTEPQVLAFASALSSVGIEAEMGGSAISRVMISIAQAVDSGGEKLNKFAQVAGMSATEFAAKFEQDAAGAITAFIEGLGRVESSGGSLFSTLQQLGFTEVEVRDALMRTANAGDLLAESLRTGEQAWVDNTALTDEASKRYETTASRMQIAQNNVNDLAITLGQTFLPVVGDVAEGLSGWISMLQDLPGPVKTGATVVGGLAGAATLVGGAAMIAVPKMVEFNKTIADMGPRGAAMASRLSSIGSFLTGPWGLALAAAAAAALLFGQAQAETAARTEELTRAIIEDHGAIADATKEKINAQLVDDGLIADAKALGISVDLVTAAFSGNKDAADELNRQLGGLEEEHQKIVDQWAIPIVWPWDEGRVKAQEQGDAIGRLRFMMGDYNKTLTEAQKKAQDHADATGQQTTKVDSLEGAMKQLNAAGGDQKVMAAGLADQMAGLAQAYGLAGDDAVAAAQKMIGSWSQAFTQFGSISGALQSAQAAASQSGVSSADRQAEAAQRLAEVEQRNAEQIKRAKREVADARERAAEQAEENAERIRSAEEALAAAQEDAARRVADAQQKVADAQRRVADVAEDSSRKIEAAAQKVADARADAADREMAAERRVQDAYARTRDALDDLNEARERAIERIQDLERSQVGAALDEESAELAIERARQRMQEIATDPDASDLDRREADLAYRRALQRLEEIRQRNSELRQELDEAHRAGVDGSAEVIQARERIAQAQQAEREAEANLAKQREENARAVAAAEQGLADARRESARQQEDAERALAKAEAELDQVRKDGAADVLKAKKGVAEAEKDAAKAMKDAAREITDAEEALRKTRKDAAADAVKAHDDVKKSWGSLGETAAVTTQQLIAEMEKQVKAQEKWADNLISLAGRVPDEMLKELAELGPGGAQVVELMTQMTEPELKHFVDLHKRSGKEAGDVFAENLAAAGPVLRDIARTRGQEVADKVREGMDGGRKSVFEAARAIGIEIDNGIGKDRTVNVFVKTEYQDELSREALRAAVQMADGGILAFADGGIQRFAGGGENHVAQIASANTIRVWAEPETGGEAYIPLAPSKRSRSEEILSEVAERFGGRFYRTMPVSRSAVSPVSGGSWRPQPVYNITVNGGLDSGPEIGARVVRSIQEFERRSGDGWRR